MKQADETSSAIGLIAEGFIKDPSRIRAIRDITIGSGLIRVLISGESSDGRLEMFEMRVPPGQPGPGPHVHEGAEECFTIVEGSAEFTVGDVTQTLGSGQSLVVPRLVPHTWHIVGDVPLRMLVTFTPSIGMELYFAELAALVAQIKAMPTPQHMRSLWDKYDTRPV